MIDADLTVFPSCVVEVLASSMAAIDSDLVILKRPLRSSDPLQSVGIYPDHWMPDERSQEIGRINPGEPTIQRYTISIQAFVKDGDETAGSQQHSALSAAIRSMLYRDPDLRLALGSLSHTSKGVTERLMRWGISNQRFLSNEVQAAWLYLSTLGFWFDTTST